MHIKKTAGYALCFLLIFSSGALAKLNDPGLSEEEIHRGWMDFDRAEGSVKIRGNYPYLECFKQASRESGVALPLLLAVARGESNFNKKAISTANCYGIMQIKWPGTANDLGITRKQDLFDPCTNIRAGAKYLAWLLKRYNGETYRAVAAYNYGPGRVNKQFVPNGAQWYAAYIYRHLKNVMTVVYEKTDRMLILEFTFYQNALEFIQVLEPQVGNIPMEIFKSNKYTYDIYMMYRNSAEREDYLRRFENTTGITPKGLM